MSGLAVREYATSEVQPTASPNPPGKLMIFFHGREKTRHHLSFSHHVPARRITMCSSSAYSVPQEAEAVFQQGILENPLMHNLPASLKELSKLVHFEGNALPSIPVNWRWAESISALKALEATMLNYLLTLKYKISPIEVTINTYGFSY